MFGIFQSAKAQKDEDRQANYYRELIRAEAKIGGTLFGPTPQGLRREFFCLDDHTWIWHEEWRDAQGFKHTMTTRYDVRPNGVLRAQEGQPYGYVSLEEGKRLYKAVNAYEKAVIGQLYPR